jgi:hypothetical protein
LSYVKLPAGMGGGSGSGIQVFPDVLSFPPIGTADTFYYAQNEKLLYYWEGTEYILAGDGPENTDLLPEGIVNLYYTDARVSTVIGLTNIADLADVRATVPSIGQILGWSGSQWQPTNLEDIAMKQYTLLLDEVSATLSYVGEALPGSLPGDPAWRIKKLDEGGTPELQIEWADGTADFDKVWDDRATYTYS